MGGVGGRRGTAPPRSRRSGTLAGAAPLLLEERQVGGRPAPARPRRARLLGAQRVPRPRRPVARAALPGGLTTGVKVVERGSPWRTARVVGISDETARAKTIRLALDRSNPHLAGQHYVARLTAEDGYSAQRSYSIAS